MALKPLIGGMSQSPGLPSAPAFTSATLTAAANYAAVPGDTQALNYLLLQQELSHSLISRFIPGVTSGSDDSGGGGATVNNSGSVRLATSTSNGGRGSWFFNLFEEFALPGLGHLGFVYFGAPMWITWKFAFTVALTTNAIFRQTIGQAGGNGGATTVLNQKGFGFGVVYKTATTGSVILYSYDSSLHTSAEVAVIDTTGNGVIHSVTAASDGTGNISFFVDGVFAATVATGPSTETAAARYLNNDIVLNGADGVSNLVYVFPITAIVKKKLTDPFFSPTWPTTVTLGDSLTYGNADPANAWRVFLQSATGATFHNASANGRTYQDLLAAFNSEVHPYAPYHDNLPALATLLIGWNNINDDPDTFYAGLSEIQTLLSFHGFYSVVMTLPRSIFWEDGSPTELNRLAINSRISANEAGFDLVFDLDSLLGPATDLRYRIALDNSHFTTEGNQLIATSLNTVIRMAFGW